MLHVKTKVMPSTIPEAGMGLFADEDIPKGTIVWSCVENVDSSVLDSDVEKMSKEERDKFILHAYKSTKTGYWIACYDGGQYVNHSEYPNLGQYDFDTDSEYADVALRDILKGEELLDNYYEYDIDGSRKLQ
jgi:hypothetical protein